MANQPETTTYDAGVYQIEVTDPVQGGVGGLANKPLLNLADRTAYLKQHMDALEAGTTVIPGVALLNGPAFTGTATAPTPNAGDNSTKIATSAFVQSAVNGIATVSVAGGANVVLTQPQWGLGIIILTGLLTASIAVIFPTQSDRWIVVNNSTGAFTVTCKTNAGTGIVAPQGNATEIYCDATNINSCAADIPFIQTQSGSYAADTGTANAYAITLSPPLAAPVIGMPKRWMALNSNTGASTFNDGGGVRGLVNADGTALQQGQIIGGRIYSSVFDGANEQLMAPAAAPPPHGQCRLTLSGGSLLLSPRDGNSLIISGVRQVVPAAGVTLGAGGLQAPVALSTVAVAANVLTVVTAAAHGRTTGDSAWINSRNLGMINGTVTAVNSTTFTVPFTHANLSSTADTGTTGALYYVYAFMSGATMTLEAVPIPHATSATTGVEVKSTDGTRTLVGLAVTTAGPAFLSPLGVISWFKRRGLSAQVPFTSAASTSSASPNFAELNANFRNFFLCWGDESTGIDVTGSAAQTATAASTETSIAVDSATNLLDAFTGSFLTGGSGPGNFPANTTATQQFGEGFHWATVEGSVSSGTSATWGGGATINNRTVSTVKIRG
jgi:hypothetical protein